MNLKGWWELARPPKRPQKYKDVPYVEFYLGRLSGVALVWLVRKALQRGDVHEFNHCSAVLAIGNTDGDHTNCPLDVTIPMTPPMALRTIVQSGWEGS